MNEILVPPQLDIWPHKAFFKRLLWSAASAVALGGLYVLSFEKHWLRIERHDMPMPNLGAELEGKTIAHISDLHCSPLVLERYLSQCVREINELDVDFVAITGDFITGTRRHAKRVARILSHLSPKIATVACLGNHDYGVFRPSGLGQMRGLEDYITEKLTHADIFVMLNESRTFRVGDAAIQFVGVEDYWAGNFDPDLAFEMTHEHLPTVGLVHNPDAAHSLADLGADWILAGHTHGTPANDTPLREMVLPGAEQPYSAGQYHLGDNKHLYVNRGLGYGRRIKLNTRPEITVFTLCRAEEKQ